MVNLSDNQIDVLIKALTEIRNMQVETNEQVMNITVNDMYKDIHLRYETFMETFQVYETFEESESYCAHVETHVNGIRFFAFID